jgi:hypothetical protein
MADQFPPSGPDNQGTPQKGRWRRPLSYLLLLAGGAGIIFNNQVSLATGISVTALQIATLGLFVVGAILFYSVRETADRVSSYREVFSSNKPAVPTTSAPVIEPASKDFSQGEPDRRDNFK